MAPKAGPSRKSAANKPDVRTKARLEIPKTNLQPGQRARTPEEKLQRQLEKVLRNRDSAAESRRKKKRELAIQEAKLAWQEDHIAALRRAFTTELRLLNRLVELPDLTLRADFERNSNAIQELLSREFVYEEEEEDEDNEQSAQDAQPRSSSTANPATREVENDEASTRQLGLPTPVPEDMDASREFQTRMASRYAAHFPGNLNFTSNMTIAGPSACQDSAINSSVVNHAPSWPTPSEATTMATPCLSNSSRSFTSSSSNSGLMLPSPPNADMDDMLMIEQSWANTQSGLDSTIMQPDSDLGIENLAIDNTNDDELFGGAMKSSLNETDPYAAYGNGHPGGFNDYRGYGGSSMMPGCGSHWTGYAGNQ
jgi:hypothetical protein